MKHEPLQNALKRGMRMAISFAHGAIIAKMVNSAEPEFAITKGSHTGRVSTGTVSKLRETVPERVATKVRQPKGRRDAADGNPGRIHRWRRLRPMYLRGGGEVCLR